MSLQREIKQGAIQKQNKPSTPMANKTNTTSKYMKANYLKALAQASKWTWSF